MAYTYGGIPSNIGNKDLNGPVTFDEIGPIPRNLYAHEQTGFVVFIDVLGVKGITTRIPPDKVFDLWRNIITQFTNALGNSTLKHTKSRFTTLSDTIVITIECPSNNVTSIFGLVMNPFLYSIRSRLFLRGAISYGKYFLSSRMMIGPAIDQAASCHDQLDWIGISAANNLSTYILKNNFHFGTDFYVFNDAIPTKENYVKGFALNWPKFIDHRTFKILIEEYEKQTKPQVIKKYLNTLNFYKKCVSVVQDN